MERHREMEKLYGLISIPTGVKSKITRPLVKDYLLLKIKIYLFMGFGLMVYPNWEKHLKLVQQRLEKELVKLHSCLETTKIHFISKMISTF